jgi:hypothetical protein
MKTIRTLIDSAVALFTNPRALAVFAVLYAVLLATLFGFIRIREATVWQVVLTMILLALIPIEFFVLQAGILQHARADKFGWAQLMRDAIKVAVVTIPMALLGYALFYLLNKWQVRYPAPPVAALPIAPGPPKPTPPHLPTVLFATLRCLLLGLALPLATIHLWIEVTARDVRTSLSGGANTVLKRLGNVFARALAFDSVLIYALGLIVFVLVPYAILFVPIKVTGTKTDFAIFIARLLLVYVFTLIGWVVTLSALVRTTAASTRAVPVTTIPATPAEAPA